MDIFNRVKDTVRDTFSSAGASVSQTTNTMKLNNLIRLNEKEIDRITLEIGKAYVSRYLQDENTEFEAEFIRIRQLQSENAKFSGEIERMKEEQEENRRKAQEERAAKDAARRQEKERQEELRRQEEQRRQEELRRQEEQRRQEELRRQEEQNRPVVPEGNVCSKCGHVNDSDAMFCANCGNPLHS